MKQLLVLIVFLALAFSCGKESDEGSGSGIKNVKGAIDSASTSLGAIVPDTSSISFTSKSDKASLNAVFTSSNHALGGDFGSSPRGFLLKHGNSSAQSSLMYRLKQALGNLCVFTTALPKTGDDINVVGDSTVTLTAALKATITSTCSADVSNIPDDTVVGYKVEDISSAGSSQFSRKVSFDTDGNGTTTQYNQAFYYTIENNTFKFSFMEDGTNDSVALFDYRNGVFRFEFSEAAGTFTAHYRGILTESTDQAVFAAYNLMNNDVSKAVVATVENGGTQLAFSYSFDDNGNTHDVTDANACITTSNMNIATDNTLTCSGVTGTNSSSWTTTLTGINSGYVTGMDETKFIQFTNSTDILTSATAQ